MAIARIKKLHILAHKSIKEEVISALQRIGTLEISAVKEADMPEMTREQRAEAEPAYRQGRLERLNRELQDVSFTLEFIGAFEPQKGAFETLFKERPLIKADELARIVEEFDYRSSCDEAAGISARLKEIQSELGKLASEFAQVKPWLGLDVSLEQIRPTHAACISMGTVPRKDFDRLVSGLKEKDIPFHVEVISEDAASKYLLVIHARAEEQNACLVLREYNFSYTLFPYLSGTPRQVLNRIQSTIDELRRERNDLEDKILWMLRDKYRLMAVYDHYLNQKRRIEAERQFQRTESAILIEGFVPAGGVANLRQALERRFSDVYVTMTDPAQGEDVPTILQNKAAVQPFETVVDLYGRPIYKGVDPTPYLAPFFALFFGICLTDAGYGLVVMALSLFLLMRMRTGHNSRRLLKLFFFGGLGAVFAGALTGGWFADIIEKVKFLAPLAPVKNAMMLFDPLKEPLKFLLICLGLGFVHISFGVLLKAIKDILAKDYKTAVLLDIPTLAIQAGLLSLLLAFSGVLPKAVLPFLWMALGISAALVVAYQWLINKEMNLRLFWSVFGLYGIVAGNFLADTLSYSRLFALGLATGLMAMAINEISLLVFSIPIVGFLVGAVLFTGAHLFNIAINVLGAYVHTSRLQYLEFFGKFFESGGRPFKPFRVETKYTVIG